ncbi:neutral trehalase [Lysinibacillus sp. 2017]|uniref:pyrimidine dimer DNA glycosylase/endonuclease V n=1 Tax=unclassified Lysinibacillus TaxID=2636778 RepID=UPI000D528F04|nr:MULTISPECIES: pyrimidine dimer DNA glycosylase/endonuclease V [unclassified Lysinibacillus]AWE08401.1 neutral trehalase [Lysinibacillus sp. 2017]TGN35752.1 neutral trehalase [Lysinibacillus sp. S2017]
MRLWHSELIPFLPKSQLLAQWRELNSIFKKQDQHILINYIYEYPKEDLYCYTALVLEEMRNRHINIRTIDKMEHYFENVQPSSIYEPFKQHHDIQYLTICYFNLLEKYIRGQKDFTSDQFENLKHFYEEKKEQLN